MAVFWLQKFNSRNEWLFSEPLKSLCFTCSWRYGSFHIQKNNSLTLHGKLLLHLKSFTTYAVKHKPAFCAENGCLFSSCNDRLRFVHSGFIIDMNLNTCFFNQLNYKRNFYASMSVVAYGQFVYFNFCSFVYRIPRPGILIKLFVT